jgi:hypothetical protein
MTHRVGAAVTVASLALCLLLPRQVSAQTSVGLVMAHQSEIVAMSHARGTFEVKLAPQRKDDYADGATLARLTIDKQFRGDLTGTSRGQMLSAGTPVKGSAGYVAIEQVTGSLAGRSGTFVFQHSGTMNRGVATLTLTVVPDSGTGELTGLTGSMKIIIADGKHAYEFDYALPGAP